MINKSDSILGAKDINEIKNILVEEVIITPGILDAIKNESQEKEIIKILENYAEIIGKNYLTKKEEFEKKLKKLKKKIDKKMKKCNKN